MTTTMKEETSSSDSDDDELYVVHEGRAGRSFEELPQIASLFLASGWTRDKIDNLIQAIEVCVNQNPILTGFVRMQGDGIFIQPCHYSPKDHSFFTELEMQDAESKMKQLNTPQEKMAFLEQNGAPLLPKLISIPEEANKRSPLFHVYLVPLPNDHLIYSFYLSHAVGDATTYYNLIAQVMALAAQGGATSNVPKIDWSGLQIATESTAPKQPELYLDHMSKQDIQRLYGIPFMIGVIPRYIAIGPRQKYMLLSKSKIDAQKRALKAPDEQYLTTNDVLVAALCKANPRVEIMFQYINVRPKRIKDEEFLGGNYLQEIPFSREAAEDPNRVRKITREGKYYDTSRVPLGPSLFNRVSKVSNWYSVSKEAFAAQPEGTDIEAHMPTPDQACGVPLDYAIIFDVDNDHVGLLHNYGVDVSDMLKELV